MISLKSGSKLLTKSELCERLNLPSLRTLEGLMRRRAIPFLVLGHRTIRFDEASVTLALAKFERKEVGR